MSAIVGKQCCPNASISVWLIPATGHVWSKYRTVRARKSKSEAFFQWRFSIWKLPLTSCHRTYRLILDSDVNRYWVFDAKMSDMKSLLALGLIMAREKSLRHNKKVYCLRVHPLSRCYYQVHNAGIRK